MRPIGTEQAPLSISCSGHKLTMIIAPCSHLKYNRYPDQAGNRLANHISYTRPGHMLTCFYMIYKDTMVGGPQKSSTNRKSANLRTIFLDLWTFHKCGILRICDMQTIYFLRFADLRFADPIIFCIKLLQIRQYRIFSLQI